MSKEGRKIEPWEASLIKAMLADETMTKDQILAYFSRPDRTVNPHRIYEIKDGKAFADLPPATSRQVRVYIEKFRMPGARQRFFEDAPLHPEILRSLIRLKDGSANTLHLSETDQIECKETLQLRGEARAKFSKTIAGFANARGGYLLFGVKDDMTVVGIPSDQLEAFDGAILNRFLGEVFTPAPVWETSEYAIGDKTVLVLHVREARKKPVICTKNAEQSLKEAEIYYRYPAETRRIKYAELIEILEERSKSTERRWADVLRHVEAAGVENVAVLDTHSGEVIGQGGRFLIDEGLIPKLKFISEGSFSETEGAPTLRLVGDLQTVTMKALAAGKTIVKKEILTDADVIQEFLEQSVVENPSQYVGYLAHSAKLWLPVFYFMRQAGLDDEAAVRLLAEKPNSKKGHRDGTIQRIREKSLPSLARQCRASASEPERSQLLAQTLSAPTTLEGCKRLCNAIMTLRPGEIVPDYIFPLLQHCLVQFGGGALPPPASIAYAIATVDVLWHLQETTSDKKTASPEFKPEEVTV